MTLAIIIVNWNVADLLRDCLTSLLAEANRHQHLALDIWVVDCASTDQSVAMVRAEFPQVHLITSQKNLGFAGGNNAALREMGFPKPATEVSEFVLFLNPDTLVKPDALRTMLTFIKSHPKVGLVGANLCFGDGSFQHGAYAFPGLWQLAIELLPLPSRLDESRLNGRYPRQLYAGKKPFPIDHPLGAAMLVRGQAIQQVGLLDEAYHMYVEEVDWAWRMKAAGWAAYCVPTAHIVHFGGQSTGQMQIESFLHLWRSRHRFYHQYYAGLRMMIARQTVYWGMQYRLRQDTTLQPKYVQAIKTVQILWI